MCSLAAGFSGTGDSVDVVEMDSHGLLCVLEIVFEAGLEQPEKRMHRSIEIIGIAENFFVMISPQFFYLYYITKK